MKMSGRPGQEEVTQGHRESPLWHRVGWRTLRSILDSAECGLTAAAELHCLQHNTNQLICKEQA